MMLKSKSYAWICLACLMLGFCFIYGYFDISNYFLRKRYSFTNITSGVTVRTTTDSKFPSYLKTSRQKGNHSVKLNLKRKDIKHCFNISFGLKTLKELGKRNEIGLYIGNLSTEGKGYVRKQKVKTLLSERDSVRCNRFVTILFKHGRTGNQMFEIASLIGIAYKYDAIPVIPKKFPLKKYFNLPNRIDTNLNVNKITRVIYCVVDKFAVFYNCKKEFSHRSNITMHGYLQSWKYFENASDIIRQSFKFKSKHLINAERFLSNVSIAGYQRVCIHVRRGDLIGKRWRFVAGVGYIERAKKIFISKYTRVQFLVISDDKEWCLKNLKDVIISPFSDPGDDLALMKLSDHAIVTVGTFGWWGAWLSGGTIVYFKKQVRSGNGPNSTFRKDDFFPKSWIGIL